jgi:hypothetical protein
MRTKVKTMRRPRGEKTQSKTINLPIDQFERITRIASRSNRSFSWVLSDLLSQKDLAVSDALDRRMVEAPTPLLPSGSISGLDDITEILAAVRDEHLVGLRGRVNALPGELETTLSTAIAVAVERETEVLRDEIRDLRRELNTKLNTQEFREFDVNNASMLATIRDEIIQNITDFISETNQGGEGPQTTSATEETPVSESKAPASESLEATVASCVSRVLSAQREAIRAKNSIDLLTAFSFGGSTNLSAFQTAQSVAGDDLASSVAIASMISAMASVDEKYITIPAEQFEVTVSLINRHKASRDSRKNITIEGISKIAGALAKATAEGAFEFFVPDTEDRVDAAIAGLREGAALDDVVAAVDQAIAAEPQYRIH